MDEQLQETYEAYEDFDACAGEKYSMAPFDRPEGHRVPKEEPETSPAGKSLLYSTRRAVSLSLRCRAYQCSTCAVGLV